MKTRVVVSCGCPVLVEHTEGTATVTCDGGGFGSNDTPGSVRRLRCCPGGIEHEVTAELTTVVRYQSRPLDPKGAA